VFHHDQQASFAESSSTDIDPATPGPPGDIAVDRIARAVKISFRWNAPVVRCQHRSIIRPCSGADDPDVVLLPAETERRRSALAPVVRAFAAIQAQADLSVDLDFRQCQTLPVTALAVIEPKPGMMDLVDKSVGVAPELAQRRAVVPWEDTMCRLHRRPDRPSKPEGTTAGICE